MFPNRKDLEKDFMVDGLDRTPEVKIAEESKTYVWVRIFLKEEKDIKVGSDIKIIYRGKEELTTLFSSYEKKNLNKDKGEQVTEFTQEEDRKILCVMVDINSVNKDKSIPFLKTLFKAGNFYEHQILKKDDLEVSYNDEKLDFHTISFNN